MNNKIPNEIKPLLFCYESKIKNAFKDKILGVYLYNSVALGAFNVNKSDIDFVTIDIMFCTQCLLCKFFAS